MQGPYTENRVLQRILVVTIGNPVEESFVVKASMLPASTESSDPKRGFLAFGVPSLRVPRTFSGISADPT